MVGGEIIYNLKSKKAERIEPITFSELGMQENDIEEILRTSIDMLCNDEESMLIVGRQVKNEKNGRSDLTAVDNYGNIVLIEIKNLMDRSSPVLVKKSKDIARRSLPKIDAMLEWGVVKAGDIIVAKGKDAEGILKANGNVTANGKEMSMQAWLKEIYGWSSVDTYVFTVHKESGKTLSQIREEYMNKQPEEMSDET